MKTLQDYILESIENDEINEGKIWNAVKKWWSNLFEPSKKKYDKYASKMDNTTLQNYTQKIKDTFSMDNLSFNKINPSSLDKIVRPNGEEPDQHNNYGFWKFVDEKVSSKDVNEIFIALVYESEEIKDTAALIKFNIDSQNNEAEIKILQVVDYFSTTLTLPKVIDFIKANSIKMLNAKKGLFIKKETDKELYNKLVNDCDFEKETINNTTNIAIYKF